MEIYFGKNIKVLRNRKGLTQGELGDLFGVKSSTVGGWETANSFPEFKVLVALREYFNMNLETLVFSDLSANSMLTVQEPGSNYERPPDNSEIKNLLDEVQRLSEQIERVRGEAGKMGVMEARMNLLERQLELVMEQLKKKD